MNGQLSFSDMEYSLRKRQGKKEAFLNRMEEIIPWDSWIQIIAPYYPSGNHGRPVKGIETMLRMYLLQDWFNLSDEGVEDAIYDSYAMRKFMKINFMHEQVPDATTLLKFRHLLEEHNIGDAIFKDVNDRLEKAGLIMHGGTIVDATIIAAPSSTKNAKGERDPEMHQTKKGNQWYHGMKVHAGVDAGTGYVHTITGTAANVHDSTEASKLIRNDDEIMYGDSGYLGVPAQNAIKQDEHHKNMKFEINKRPSSLKTSDDYNGINWDKKMEHDKSSVRCKVEHAFLIVKNTFGYSKVAYKGIKKNMNRFNFLFASANLLMCSRAGRTAEFCKG
ncbi:IS5 family transposase [Ruminococcus sp. HUN007]|uniref:IS5 family transposase n=1 Tax=Ruminococcus sp. HUN007 TaxID=1514668 RepID=UPI0005D19588|nr:IS5 family transposase [Ruminococcus sp. HUN007]